MKKSFAARQTLAPLMFALLACLTLAGCAQAQPEADAEGVGISAQYAETILHASDNEIDCGLYARADGSVDYLSQRTNYPETSELVVRKYRDAQLVSERSIALGSPAASGIYSFQTASGYRCHGLFFNCALAGDGALYINASKGSEWAPSSCILRLAGDADDIEQCEEVAIRNAEEYELGERGFGGFSLPVDDTLYFNASHKAANDTAYLALDLRTLTVKNSLLGEQQNQILYGFGRGIVWSGMLFWPDADEVVYSKYLADNSKTPYPKTALIAYGRRASLMSSGGFAELPLLCGADDEAIYYVDLNGIQRMKHGSNEIETLVSAEGRELEADSERSFLGWSVKRAVKAENGDFYTLLYTENHELGASRELVCYSAAANALV